MDQMAGKPLSGKTYQGEWGFLAQEPCRFCRQQGGVYFIIDEGPEGKAGLQIQRCDKCHRTWTADSSSA